MASGNAEDYARFIAAKLRAAGFQALLRNPLADPYVLGVSSALIGTLWAIYGLWNAINDPLMGQLSDRTRSRYGRRVPYVMFGAIPLGLSFFFLWTPPTQSPFILAAYFLMILFIFDTLYSLTIIAYNALFTEVAPTPRDRIDLSATREILATVALLLSFILAPIIAEEVGYFTMGAIMGALIALLSAYCCRLRSRERMSGR